MAVLFFHGVHIPYIATPAMRAKYAGKGIMNINAQDYWGTVSQISMAVGRVRGLLRQVPLHSALCSLHFSPRCPPT